MDINSLTFIFGLVWGVLALQPLILAKKRKEDAEWNTPNVSMKRNILGSKVRVVPSDVYIIDGDTIKHNDVRYRLHGIDAPELGAQGGAEAAEMLKNLTSFGYITIRIHDTDHYGRKIATLHNEEMGDINKQMVRRGYAHAYLRYSAKYKHDQFLAKSKKAGLWRHGDKGFINPETYRHYHQHITGG